MKSLRPLITLLLFLTLANALTAQAPKKKKSFKDKLSLSMIMEMDLAYGFSSASLQKTEYIFKPKAEYRFSRNLRLVAIGRLYTELTDNLEPGIPSQEAVSPISRRLFLGDRTELELRELYAHIRLWKKLTLRVGKQQVVWGETDGLKLLDVMNPQYFREFLLDQFEDSRIPLWSIKAEFPLGKLKTQLVWIPDQSYHVLPALDAPYFPKALFPTPPPGANAVLNPAQRPGRVIADSDIGIKLGAFVKGWDLTLNYLYHYDDLPALYQSLKLSPGGEPMIEITPRYERLHTLGGTFNKPLGPVTLRGELAYAFGKYFPSANPLSSQGLERSDQFNSALGLDYIRGETLISLQWFSDLLVDKVPAYNRDRWENYASLLFSRELFNDSFKAEVIWVQGLNRGDGLVRPKLSYWLRSNMEVQLGVDLFYGTETGLLGQFGNRSRISTGFVLGI